MRNAFTGSATAPWVKSLFTWGAVYEVALLEHAPHRRPWRPLRWLLIGMQLLCGAEVLAKPSQSLTGVPTDIGAMLVLGAWRVEASPLHCAIERDIPAYGIVRFEREAGASLQFAAQPKRPQFAPGSVQIATRTPSWHPKHPASVALPDADAARDRHRVTVAGNSAVRLLSALHAGYAAEVSYDRVSQPEFSVTVSGVGLAAVYDQYLACAAQLFEFGYRDVARTAVRFEHAKAILDDSAKEALDRVARYLTLDDGVTQLFLDGHTDNSGVEKINLPLSKARAEVVRDYLVAQGVDQDKLVLRYHADRYPAAGNDNPDGRSRNRRTTVRLEHSDPVRRRSLAATEMQKPQRSQQQAVVVPGQSRG